MVFQVWDVECSHCGRYHAGGRFLASLAAQNPTALPILGGLVRRRKGGEPLILPQLDNEDFQSVLERMLSSAPSTPADKGDALLAGLARETKDAGAGVNIDLGPDRTLAFAHSKEEFQFLLDQMESEGLVLLDRKDIGGSLRARLTMRGWDLGRSRAMDASSSIRAFVAMPFEDGLQRVYDDGIIPGISGAGFQGYRINEVPHADRIDDRIMSEIKECRFVVADTTNLNRNVLFEAGFALGLGKPVIWTCRDDSVKELAAAFDIRQYNHLRWCRGEEGELATPLENAIRNIVGSPSNAT